MYSSNLLLEAAATVPAMGKTLNQVLAENLRAKMDGAWTQSSLSKKSGVGQTTISLYLSPERRGASASGREPSAKLAEVEKLADALGCEPLSLLTDRDAYPLPFDLLAELHGVTPEALKSIEDMLRGALAVAPKRAPSKRTGTDG